MSRSGRCLPGSSAAGSTSTSPPRLTFRMSGMAWSRCGPAAWVSGGCRARRARRRLEGSPPRRECGAVRRCRRARPAGGPGDRADRQLLQPGAVRRADQPAVGPGDHACAPDARVRRLCDVPADVPVRADLRPGARCGAGVAGSPPFDPPPGPVRALRRRVLGVPDLRGIDPGRPVRSFPRPAAELLRRLRDQDRQPGARPHGAGDTRGQAGQLATGWHAPRPPAGPPAQGHRPRLYPRP
jgi:hypothetical protein